MHYCRLFPRFTASFYLGITSVSHNSTPHCNTILGFLLYKITPTFCTSLFIALQYTNKNIQPRHSSLSDLLLHSNPYFQVSTISMNLILISFWAFFSNRSVATFCCLLCLHMGSSPSSLCNTPCCSPDLLRLLFYS